MLTPTENRELQALVEAVEEARVRLTSKGDAIPYSKASRAYFDWLLGHTDWNAEEGDD